MSNSPHALDSEGGVVRMESIASLDWLQAQPKWGMSVEVTRMVMPAGKILSEHKDPGEITVQCLEGRISFTSMGNTHELQVGEMLYLTAAEPHSVAAIEDSSFLLTIFLHDNRSRHDE